MNRGKEIDYPTKDLCGVVVEAHEGVGLLFKFEDANLNVFLETDDIEFLWNIGLASLMKCKSQAQVLDLVLGFENSHTYINQ